MDNRITFDSNSFEQPQQEQPQQQQVTDKDVVIKGNSFKLFFINILLFIISWLNSITESWKEKYLKRKINNSLKTFEPLISEFIDEFTIRIRYKLKETGDIYQLVLEHPTAYKTFYHQLKSPNESINDDKVVTGQVFSIKAIISNNYKQAMKIS